MEVLQKGARNIDSKKLHDPTLTMAQEEIKNRLQRLENVAKNAMQVRGRNINQHGTDIAVKKTNSMSSIFEAAEEKENERVARQLEE